MGFSGTGEQSSKLQKGILINSVSNKARGKGRGCYWGCWGCQGLWRRRTYR